MSKSLPRHVNPWLLFRHHETVAGSLALTEMPNLSASQNLEVGEAHVQLSVEKRHDGHMILLGEASIELELICQRCLRPFRDFFSTHFELVLVKYERQLASVDDDDDAMVVEEELLIAPLIEQELLLELPMIAKHDDCEMRYDNAPTAEAERQQPFANLKDLLN